MSTAQAACQPAPAVVGAAATGADAAGDYLADLLGRPFTRAQLAAATAPLHPLLVVAGAGSGKTTVMAARVVHAVAYHGLSPAAILGLTFTNKAANELSTRVRGALDALRTQHPVAPGQPDPYDESPTIATYHAYAGSLVTDHALRIGRESDVRLLTEAARFQLALAVTRAARGPFPALDFTTVTVAQRLLALDGEMSEHLVEPDEVLAAGRAVEQQLARAEADGIALPAACAKLLATGEARAQLLTLMRAYRERKARGALVDFGDQVALAARIAEQVPAVGAAERHRFALVLLDEYQDTGVAQRRLLAVLYAGGHPVTAVGDPCQSIYGWRGASAGNLARFAEHFPGGPPDPAYLATSFRNDGRVLSAANSVSAALRAPGADRGVRVEVPELDCPAARRDAGRVVASWHRSDLEESEWVAEQVAAAVASGTPPGEVAVLCRRRSDFARLHEALVAQGLPVEVVGLGGLLVLPEVAEIVAMLEVLADPTANAALVRVLTGPRYRLGPRDLAALGRRARQLAGAGPAVGGTDADRDGAAALAAATASVDPCDVVALTDAIDSPGSPTAYSLDGVARLRELNAELSRLRPLLRQPVVDAVTGIIRAIGLDVEVAASMGRLAEARTANLAAFIDHAARFESVVGESDLSGFLAWLSAARDAEDGLDTGPVSQADTVKVLTVHKAKGLEWSVVAVPGLVDAIFPASKGRPRWTENAAVLPHRLRGDRDDLPADPELTAKGFNAFRDACRVDAQAEERRLAYVAVTRAKHLLVASGYRWAATRTRPCEPSPYLLELRDAGAEQACWHLGSDDEDHPGGGGEPDVAWPAAYDPHALGLRREAAQRVRGALASDRGGVDGDPSPQALAWAADADRLLAELARERDAEQVVTLPTSLSTSLALRVVSEPDAVAAELARPMPRRPQAAGRRGTRFHAWVQEQFTARPLLGADELPAADDDAWPDDEEFAAIQAAFLASPYAQRVPVAVETPFAFRLAGRTIRGRIDAVFAEGTGFEVVDWKTGRASPDRLQLAVYRLAWAALAGVPPEQVSASFLAVPSGRITTYDDLPDAVDLARLLAGPDPSHGGGP